MGDESMLKKIKKSISKAIASTLCVCCLTGGLLVSPVCTTKTEAFGLVGAAIAAGAAYDKWYRKFTTLGFNPMVQAGYVAQGEQKITGPIAPADSKLIDDVMGRLLDNGFFVMDHNALPFRWQVISDTSINASCNFADYIEVNQGLIRYMNGNKDEIAAVLGHEMTHGLRHHVAKSIARNACQKVAVVALSDNMDEAKLLLKIQEYSAARNISMPMEHESDEEGFYILCSAGFNPGGTAAAMYKLYINNPTRHPFLSDFNSPADHPDNINRLRRAEDLLNTYGIGHVSVKNGDEVFIDDVFLLKAKEEGTTTSNEMAYFIAGGIAKGFHDNRLLTSWWFKPDKQGNIDYLDNNEVYRPLKKAVLDNGLGAQFQAMVENAYKIDSQTHGRDDLGIAEMERKTEWKEQIAESYEPSKAKTKKYQKAALAYKSLNMTGHALSVMDRAIKSDGEDVLNREIRGTLLLDKKEYLKAVEDCNVILKKDPKSLIALLIRAKASFGLNDYNSVLSDCNLIKECGGDIANYKDIEGMSFDAIGEEDKALLSFKELHAAAPSVAIPEKYLTRLQ